MTQENLKKEKGVSGFLHIHEDGYGFLRPTVEANSSPDDIYVSLSQIRSLGLKNGNFIRGLARPPRDDEKFFSLSQIDLVDYKPLEKLAMEKVSFSETSAGLVSEILGIDELSRETLPQAIYLSTVHLMKFGVSGTQVESWLIKNGLDKESASIVVKKAEKEGNLPTKTSESDVLRETIIRRMELGDLSLIGMIRKYPTLEKLSDPKVITQLAEPFVKQFMTSLFLRD